jgi:hypothetical protein
LGGLYECKATADLITLGQMLRALKGYPCPVKQFVRATVLILLVSLLSGCSNSSKPADKPLAKTECEIAIEKSSELLKKASEVLKTKGRDASRGDVLLWGFFVIEKSNCFTAETVAQAKTLIALYQ